jgi:hypothetical protein
MDLFAFLDNNIISALSVHFKTKISPKPSHLEDLFSCTTSSLQVRRIDGTDIIIG